MSDRLTSSLTGWARGPEAAGTWRREFRRRSISGELRSPA